MSTKPEAPAPNPNIITLEDGERWVEVRRLSIGDIRTAKLAAHDRGWDDADLDAIGLFPDVIINTSAGPVTPEFVDSISETDFGKIWLKVKGIEIPNSSAASSTGTSRSRTKANQTKTS